MKSKYIILFIGALIISLSSCLEDLLCVRGNGITETEIRRSGMFYRLENSTSIDVVYKKADTTGITIKADENLLEYIVTETNDNTLEIKARTGNTCLDFKERPLITITSPNLEQAIISGSGAFIADEMFGDAMIIKMSGSGDISAERVSCTGLTVMLSGSGNINIKNCQSITSDIFLSGSGSINIKGKSEDCDVKITGSGEVFAENFLLGSASVIISGSGNAFINVEHALTGIISGSGNIYLKGNPTISQTISGSGKIIKYK
ncbi:MAG: head GIN domain-containing protein [Bacteroidota bacterium]